MSVCAPAAITYEHRTRKLPARRLLRTALLAHAVNARLRMCAREYSMYSTSSMPYYASVAIPGSGAWRQQESAAEMPACLHAFVVVANYVLAYVDVA
jgi:hypothetical protein